MSRACPLLGFVAELELKAEIAEPELQVVRESFAALLVERGLECEERGTRTHWFRSIRSEAGQATNADREAVEGWARNQPAIDRVSVGAVLDLGAAP